MMDINDYFTDSGCHLLNPISIASYVNQDCTPFEKEDEQVIKSNLKSNGGCQFEMGRCKSMSVISETIKNNKELILFLEGLVENAQYMLYKRLRPDFDIFIYGLKQFDILDQIKSSRKTKEGNVKGIKIFMESKDSTEKALLSIRMHTKRKYYFLKSVRWDVRFTIVDY